MYRGAIFWIREYLRETLDTSLGLIYPARSIQLWRLDGHTKNCALCGPWDDGLGTHGSVFFFRPGQLAEDLHFCII